MSQLTPQIIPGAPLSSDPVVVVDTAGNFSFTVTGTLAFNLSQTKERHLTRFMKWLLDPGLKIKNGTTDSVQPALLLRHLTAAGQDFPQTHNLTYKIN